MGKWKVKTVAFGRGSILCQPNFPNRVVVKAGYFAPFLSVQSRTTAIDIGKFSGYTNMVGFFI